MRIDRLSSISNQLRSTHMDYLSEAIRIVKEELEEQRMLVIAAAKKSGITVEDLVDAIKQMRPNPQGAVGDKLRWQTAAYLIAEVNQSTTHGMDSRLHST